RFNTFLHFQPTPRQSYSLFASLGRSEESTGGTRASRTLGSSAQWELTRSANFRIQYSTDHYAGGLDQDRSTASASLRYTLPNRHTISAQGRWIRQQSPAESHTSVSVSYDIPLG